MHPHLTRGSSGPPESTSQTASPSVQPIVTDRQKDRQTDHATPSVTIGRIYVRSTDVYGLKCVGGTVVEQMSTVYTVYQRQ